MLRDMRGVPISEDTALEEAETMLARLEEQREDDIVGQRKLREARLQVIAVRNHG